MTLLSMRKSTKILLLLLAFVFLNTNANATFEYYEGEPNSAYVPVYGALSPSSQTDYLPLSGTWNLKGAKEETQLVTVPGCWQNGQGEATLITSFKVPEEWKARSVKLVIWGGRRQLSIKLNERLIEAGDSDWPMITVDIPSGLLRWNRNNDLEIEVNDKLSARESIPLKSKLFDEMTYVGIYGDVALVAGPTSAIESVKWETKISKNYKYADWSINLGMRNQRTATDDSINVRRISVTPTWTSPSGNKGEGKELSFDLDAVEIAQINLNGRINSPELWSFDEPNLYRFELLFNDGKMKWTVPYQFGIADIEWNNSYIKINEKKHTVRGIDLRQETRENGIALSKSQIKEDLQRIKNQGFNLVRIIGEVPHPATAALCDQLGLLVIPETGLRGVPEKILGTSVFKDRLGKMMLEMIKRDGTHVSVAAWGMMGWSSANAGVLRTVEQVASSVEEYDKRPVFVGFASHKIPDLPPGVVGMRQRPPYKLFRNEEPFINEYDDPWLVGDLGGFVNKAYLEEDSVRGQVRQADALLHQMKAVRKLPVSGFIIDGFADRRSAWPLLVSGARKDCEHISRGLLNVDREERISWSKVGEALGQLRIDAPTLELPVSEFPVVFPIATMIIGGILLLVMRQNNVFRQNLKRVFAHTHGFFVDIRDRRYFQAGQTILVALIFASSQAVLTASWLYHSRFDFALDYFLTLLLPIYSVKVFMVQWAWHPIQGILAFTGIFFVLLFVFSILILIVSLPFRAGLKFRQAFSLVSWGTTHFTLIIPLGWIHFQLLDYAWFNYIVTALLIFFWVWYFYRISSMLRIGYRITGKLSLILLLVLLIVIIGSVFAVYRNGFAINEYLEFYTNVIIPWVNA